MNPWHIKTPVGKTGVGELVNQFIIDSVAFGQTLFYSKQPPDLRRGYNDAKRTFTSDITMQFAPDKQDLLQSSNPNPFGFVYIIAQLFYEFGFLFN